jgi:F-type H+-transporting ATPase subunit b
MKREAILAAALIAQKHDAGADKQLVDSAIKSLRASA